MRRTKDVFITEEGRDSGKVFCLTEMPAMQSEKWAIRVFLALAKAGVQIPDDIAQRGLAGVAIVGIQMLGGISFSEAEPLLDEMMQCVTIYPNYHQNSMMKRPTTGQDDIEEVATLKRLRQEVIELHLGFTLAEALSKLPTSAPTTSAT